MEVQFFSKTVNELNSEILAEMYHLFERYYVDVSFEQFKIDIQEKTHVLFIRNKQNVLVGFSTIFRKKLPAVGKGVFMFSGDTVIREDYWGTKYLQKAFFYFILQTKLSSPFQPVYWMLISKGYKTYMMMRRNFLSCWPRRDEDTPPTIKNIQDRFYRYKFGDCYNPETNLIVFDKSMGAVKGDMAAPSAESMKNLDVQFFLEKNPRYNEGEELACVTEIMWKDFTFHILKYFIPKKYEDKIKYIYEGYRKRRTRIT